MALRDIVIKDLSWKLFSLALAAVIWMTVRPGSKEPAKGGNPLTMTETRPFTNLRVVIMSSAADVREFRVRPDTVNVSVSGRTEVLAALTERDFRVTVDLTEIESTRGMRARVNVAVPPGVTFIAATPSEVNVVVPPKRDLGK